ncbi:MAG: acyl-CoA thioesterase [Lentisphaerae bacterium]|nr:acyl-CoA thioesterase [Lentisphaerota bacterium]
MPYFDCTYRVPYADTDQMQVVYYANYLEYFERSRTEMLRSVGFPYSEMEKMGFFLPVREVNVIYHSSACYDDLLTLRSWVKEARGARLVIASEVRRNDEVLVSGTVTLCCVNAQHRVSRLPEEIMAAAKLLSLDSTEGQK